MTNINTDVQSNFTVLRYDANKDGKTSIEEFLKGKGGSIFGTGFDDENKKALELLKKHAATEGDAENITDKEYTSWLNDKEYVTILEDYKLKDAARIKEARKNGTYKPSFGQANITLKDKQYIEDVKNGLYKNLDTSKDGKVSVDEFIASIKKQYDDRKYFSEEDYNKYVQVIKANADKKGFISVEACIKIINSAEAGKLFDDERIKDADEIIDKRTKEAEEKAKKKSRKKRS